MAKMKFDFKQFVMQKGERVGLGVALGLMALLFIWGILGALGARSPAKEIASAADDLTRKVNQSGPEDDTKVKPPEVKEWIPGVDPNWLRMAQLFDPNAAGNPKRTSPLVLPVDYRVVDNGDSKYPVLVGQMNVVFLGVKSFDVLNENVYYLKPKGGAVAAGKGGGGILGGSGGKLSGQGGTSPGPGGFRPGGPGGMKGGGATSDKKYKDILVPVHAVVVSGTFPVKDQLELIRKALRYNSVEELFNSGGSDNATPEFGGLVVLRRELTPDGKLGEWADLKLDDPAGPTLKQYALFRGFEPEDEDQLKHILPGLVMPRPYSLTTHYPPVDLKDIPKGEAKKEEVANAGQPGILGPGGRAAPGGIGGPGGMGGRGGPGGLGGGLVRQVVHYEQLGQKIDSLPKEYEGPEEATQPKLKGDFDIFEVGGYPREEGDKGAAVNPKQPGAMYGKPGGNRPPGGFGDTVGPGGIPGRMQQGGQTGRVAGVGPDKQPDKALVRFVDVTVKPGHSYQYMVKVRLRNPNFKKKTHEIATSDLAKKVYLESAWVFTEPVHVGPEIHFFNVDQRWIEPLQDFFKKKLEGTDINDTGKERVAVQIHRFLGIVKGTAKDKFGKKEVGEWSIAERLLVPRGEYIGQPVKVEVPAWDFEQDDFELINGKTNPLTRQKSGTVVIDFSTRQVPAAKSLVVDFRGGKHPYYVEPVGKVDQSVDEAATELLFLGADGKLAVRNSRSDTDPQNPPAVERAARLEHLRDRLRTIKQPPPPTAPGGGGGRGQ